MRRDVPQNLQRFKHVTSKQDIYFFSISGIVVADKIWSETHVSSYGGGGYINQGSGYVSAPSVSSSVTEKREFWFRSDDGKEHNLRVKSNVKVNSGNDVSVLYCGSPQTGYDIAVVNRTTGYWHGTENFRSWYTSNYLRNTKTKAGGGALGCLAAIVAFVGLLTLFDPHVDGGLKFVTVSGFVALVAFSRGMSVAKKKQDAANNRWKEQGLQAFNSHCEAICQSLF